MTRQEALTEAISALDLRMDSQVRQDAAWNRYRAAQRELVKMIAEQADGGELTAKSAKTEGKLEGQES